MLCIQTECCVFWRFRVESVSLIPPLRYLPRFLWPSLRTSQVRCMDCYGLSVFDATAKRKQSSILQTKLSKFSFSELVVRVGSRNMEFKCQLHCTRHFNLKQIKSYRSEKVIKRKVLTFNLNIEVYFLLFSRITFSVQKNFYYKV